MNRLVLAMTLAGLAHVAWTAPDEDKLGKQLGYPVGTAKTWFFDESTRVGSFTAQGVIPGILGGNANVLKPSHSPMHLARAAQEPTISWHVNDRKQLAIDDYLSRQRIMGLMIIKDGVVQVERYQYERTPKHRFLSNSMAKSITSLAVGFALQEGKIRSLDDRAELYAKALRGTLLGQTTIRNLLRMASGARFSEEYTGRADAARLSAAITREGIETALRGITE